MGFRQNLSYQWARLQRAHRDTIDSANSWAWLLGYAAVWGVLGIFGFTMIEANGPGGVLLIGVVTLVVAWLLIVGWRFVFVAPRELYQEIEEERNRLYAQVTKAEDAFRLRQIEAQEAHTAELKLQRRQRERENSPFHQMFAEEARQSAKEAAIPKRDVWLTDAVYYICLGEWVEKDPNLLDDTRFVEQTMRVDASLKMLRQAAIDSEITIWGWSERTSAFVETEAAVWKEYELEWMSFLNGRENMKAEVHPSKRARIETLTQLKTSTLQVYKLRQKLSRSGDLKALEIPPQPPAPQSTEPKTSR